jgi:hypothetical protein
MFSKFNTKTLIIILVLLTGVIALVFILDNREGGRTIREELIRIDSATVTAISIYPPAENRTEIRLEKKGKNWIVRKDKVTAEADEQRLANILSNFKLLKPNRLAATDKSQWKEYGVDDTLGTRMKFYAGDKLVGDIVIGKFSYNNSTRSSISYVRLPDEEVVYAIDGFIAMAVNHPFGQWRNKAVLRADKSKFTRISFSYPADTAFILTKENNKWKIGAQTPDSAKVEQFLTNMTMVNSLGFIDNYVPATPPVIMLTMEGNNMTTVTIQAYPADSTKKYVIRSSYNPSVCFSAREYGLDGMFFKSKSFFFPTEQSRKKLQGKR